ncbi:nucleotidyltransferase domain-containing protein [Archangium lipolyticum]|uniref:nucleotidyltransferase domain-containing protein n=1 Tax=Archangium lipolyticum TaxID=2970465 RepID=UPI002149F6FE|nr:nucleotidyltransferase domain-containing protein [Archangium lipolyticum]
MEEEISLVGLTEDMRINSVIIGFIDLCLMVFPMRLRACYLLGSHASRDAVSDSDLDLVLVFKDRLQEGEAERLERFRRSVNAMARFPLDVSAEEEARLLADGAVNLKQTSLLLAGEDIRERIPLLPLDQWVRFAMHRPYIFMERARARAEGEPLRYPLKYPDPRGTLYGYDHSAVMDAEGNPRPGFKELVTLACRLAMADLARKAGRYACSKREIIEAHRQHVNDAWSLLFEQIYACRKRWGYRVPEAPADQEHLRSLCARILDAENLFLGSYKDFLLAELQRGEVRDRVLAARRLGEILYPGDEVPAALNQLEAAPEPELREAARESLRLIAQYSAS